MSEREQLRRVRCFLPPHVMNLITTRSEAELLAFEQREITVVFCDLRGFTAFAHTAASAEIVDVLGAYHRGVGPLIVAAGGILERFFAAIGPVTNLASRLCADASAGQILMEERLYSDLHDVLEAEPLGARWLKGFTAAVNVYSVRAVATKRTLTAPRRPAEAASQWH